MFKNLKSTTHNVAVKVDIDTARTLRPVIRAAAALAVIGVASHAANNVIDMKLVRN